MATRDITRDLGAGRRAKIICTLGPSTDAPGALERLVRAGTDAVRINLSFEDAAAHTARIERLRQIDFPHRPLALIADLPGRKTRIGKLEGGEMSLSAEQEVRFVPDEGQIGDAGEIPADRALFHENMIRGDRILLSAGSAELVVTAYGKEFVDARVIYGDTLRQMCGVHAQGMPIPGAPLTAADLKAIEVAIALDADFVALTYITDAREVVYVREKLAEMGKNIPVIVKIERSETFSRLDGILRRADAVMLRRGDLGAEIEVTRVPLVQREILRLANNRGVPVIIATQMLGSMISSPRPTRAEASDVANAIKDGADGVLLGPETAIGNYPVEAVEMMARIATETEREHFDLDRNVATISIPSPFADTTARIAGEAAEQVDAKIIACFTESGRTAGYVAKYRPKVPIIAFCPSETTRRRLAVHWGVRSQRLDVVADVDLMVKRVEERLLAQKLVTHGDRLVIVYGAPCGKKGHTNSLRLHEVGATL